MTKPHKKAGSRSRSVLPIPKAIPTIVVETRRYCHYCARRLRRGHPQVHPSRDHVTPKHAGGKFTVDCCHQCNHIKGGMSAEEWRDFMVRHPEWWRTFRDHGAVAKLRKTAHDLGAQAR